MSTPPPSIPFSYTNPQSPVRLLELPPALLSIITSDPSTKLRITSSPASPSTSVLCTPTQTFQLRQVNSSNTTYLLAPSSDASINALATIHSHLEVALVTPDVSAVLRGMLRPYHGWEEEDAAMPDATAACSQTDLAADVPASQAEFLTAWKDTMAFEIAGASYRPTPAVALAAMQALWMNCAAAGMSFARPFTLAEVVAAVDEEPPVPGGLVEAVVRRVCDEGEEGWVLDGERCRGVALECVVDEWRGSGQGGRPSDQRSIKMLETWLGAVPMEAAERCTLKELRERFTGVGVGVGMEEVKMAEAPKKGKGKWHERLGKGKK